MVSKTSIFTMATTHIGRDPVGDAVTSQTPEAKKCRAFYDEALDFVLADHDWGFASKQEALALADVSEYRSNFDYAYLYPGDCVQLREIVVSNGSIYQGHSYSYPNNPNPVDITSPPYQRGLSSDGASGLIFTDEKGAVMRYTKRVTDPNLFSPGFVMCISFYLAYLISFHLTRKRTVKSDMLAEYQRSKFMAMGHDANETIERPMPEAEAIRSRG